VNDERLFFDTLKLDRGSFFVEYTPPITSYPFATLQLVFPNAAEASQVALAMERELVEWLGRYEVPVMVSAFDDTGNPISLNGFRASDHLVGWTDPASKKPLFHWRLVTETEFPRHSWDSSSLRSIYADIPFRTSTDLKKSARKQRSAVQFGWWLVVIWAVVIPVAIAVVDYNAPEWLERIALMYSLARAYIEFMKLKGWWPKPEMDIAALEEDRRMRHHHYHCERNPEAFKRLKWENAEREAREAVQREAASLKATGHEKAR
jgi:hypothetical protein